MRRFTVILLAAACLLTVAWIVRPSPQHVGDQSGTGTIIPVGDPVDPQGTTVYLPFRPVQIEALRDGTGVIVLHNEGISLYDLPGLTLRQNLPTDGGASMCGLSVSNDGKLIAVSGAHSTVSIAELKNGNLAWTKKLVLPAPAVKGDAYPCGLSWTTDDRNLLICASRSNLLLEYEASDWRLTKTFGVDPAPFEVDALTPGVAYVTCWSAKPALGDQVADASGTNVPVDDRGIVKEARIDRIDLNSGERITNPSGRQPSNLARVEDGLVIPCANDDSLEFLSKDERLLRYDLSPIFGKLCSPTWAAYSDQSNKLAVTLGRVNQLALFSLNAGGPTLDHVLNTNWYPACVVPVFQGWLVACAEGNGSRSGINGSAKRSVYDFHGSLSLIPFGSKSAQIAKPQANLPPRSGIAPVPVPERQGEPSVFHHIVYILKENRTYDQVLGDLPQGDGSAALCDYPRKVSPNHHKLAEDFVLLDNYYCNGILSADGHAWAMEGNSTSYFERTFGGFTRSYPYGDDPLSVSSTGFIWNDVLAHGKSFRNYGEFDYAGFQPNDGWQSLFKELTSGVIRHRFTQNIGVASLRRYTRAGYPGWNLSIPDVLRASVFLDDLKNGRPLADFTIIYLPQDHTAGDAKDEPTPASCVADNDLALGRIVDGISHSPYWKDTCIFANEDDPQAGYDHIDGHRSVCLVVSPYTLRNRVVSRFYNQTSVLKTMERMLGLPPMNRLDAESPLMTACFSPQADFRPYDAVPNQTPLDQMNKGADHHLRFEKPDLNDDLTFNRILWHMAHPSRKYPEQVSSGLHRRGLYTSQSNDRDDD